MTKVFFSIFTLVSPVIYGILYKRILGSVYDNLIINKKSLQKLPKKTTEIIMSHFVRVLGIFNCKLYKSYVSNSQIE